VRLLILNGDLPVFPGWGGVEYLHTTRLARLARRVGLVSLLHTLEQREKSRRLREAGVALYLWEAPTAGSGLPAESPARHPVSRRLAEKVYHFARNWGRRPTDTLGQDMQFRNLAGPLLEALQTESWQALVVVQSACAHWLDYVPEPPVSVLVMHDVRALLYERRAQLPGSLLRRALYQLQARRYRRFERAYSNAYDLVITVSSTDADWVRRHYRPPRVLSLPIPVDSEYFRPMLEVASSTARIVFTGMMNHPPNVDAACFFARTVLPSVRAADPNTEFWIVGRDPTPAVGALAALPGVVVTGAVPDMRPQLAAATVVVVPLRFGSGMRQKILEAWAMEKCVVSTPLGAEGLDARDGENILLATGADALAGAVTSVLADAALRDRIRTRGRAVVLAQHDPGPLAATYWNAVKSVAREKRDRADPMRVAIDLRWMRPGHAGGIENLSRSFLDHLVQLDGFNRYTLLLPSEACRDFDLRGHPNVRVTVVDGLGRYIRSGALESLRVLHRCAGISYWRTREVETLRRAHELRAEVALSMPGYIHPDVRPLRNVLVVPDIQHEYWPDLFSPRDLNERRTLHNRSAREAAHVCAISEFTRRTLIERLGVPPERVTTVYPAASPLFHPDSAARAGSARVLERYGLQPQEYLLFPANTWRHKNHQQVVAAMGILRDLYGLEPLLICTGAPKEAHADVLAAIRRLRLEHTVRFLGYCPPTDMPGLYEGAAALVFPSLFEGFGLPLVEAMWCDCPIVCSNTTSLPEIAGDSALLIDPRSAEDLAHAINRVLTDDVLRRDLVERGRRRAADFSWTTFTLEVVRVLHEVWLDRYR
jgi:glycosyltransferase involved in cell wall biosynthesis